MNSISPFLVTLSVVIGIISSYIALILLERMSDQQRKRQIYWVFFGSVVMGMGIFSMHFIGMMAFQSNSLVVYDPLLLFISFVAAIIASFSAFYILYLKSVTKLKVFLSGVTIGTGIVLMHYIGMFAIILPVPLQFDLFYIVLSILTAIIFSIFALKVFFEVIEKRASAGRKMVSAVILGVAVSLMHYIGMKGAYHEEHSHYEAASGIQPFSVAIFVSIAMLSIFIIASYLAFLNSRTLMIERALMVKVRQSEERFRRSVELSPEPIVIHSEGEIAFINEASLKMIGEANKSDLIGKSILDYVHPAFKNSVEECIQDMKIGFKAPLMEQQIITSDGSVIDVEITGFGIEFEGKPAIQLMMRNITEKKKTKRELDENQQRYHSLFKHNPDGIYSLDATGQLIGINPSLEGILGYSLEDLITMTFHELVDPDHLEMTNQMFIKALEGIPQNYETIAIRKNGDRIPLEITNMPIIIDEKVTGVFGVAKDISKEKEAVDLLEENEEKYRSLFDYNLDAVFEIDQSGFFTDANKMTETLTGFSKAELLLMPFQNLLEKDWEKANAFFSTVIGGSPVTFEQTTRHKDGELKEIDISAVPKRKQGKVDGVFAIVRDITEKKQAQVKINELAFTDQLTGLPNRHWFYQNLQKVVKRAGEQHESVAILLLDFDDFKSINDEFGHFVGDLYLKKVTERIQACLRKEDTISRLGGDEFTIVLENVAEAYLSQLAEQILEEMKKPISLLDKKIVMSLSIGICIQTDRIHDGETLIRQADIAMYSAKEKGKNNYQFFSEELNEKVTRKIQLEKALRNAIEQEEFQLHYQPQVDLKTEKLVGFEALIRWNSPTGLVPPLDFIPLAEETGLILPIGEWVIREACRQMKKWEKEGRSKVKVAVNVSARQFNDVDFAWKLKEILEDENVEPSYLEIEITESVMMDVKESSLFIQELKKLGVKIAIDDFGAGYSSLNVIKNFEIDTLKTDKSLIDEVLSNRRNMLILAAIIDVGKKLSAEIIVEGIELKEQVIALKEFDVIGQGYFYSRPLPAEQLEQIWHKKSKTSR